MPIYEYRCTYCDRVFEKLVMSDEDELDIVCPECGDKHIEKIISPSVLEFKNGQGFERSELRRHKKILKATKHPRGTLVDKSGKILL